MPKAVRVTLSQTFQKLELMAKKQRYLTMDLSVSKLVVKRMKISVISHSKRELHLLLSSLRFTALKKEEKLLNVMMEQVQQKLKEVLKERRRLLQNHLRQLKQEVMLKRMYKI